MMRMRTALLLSIALSACGGVEPPSPSPPDPVGDPRDPAGAPDMAQPASDQPDLQQPMELRCTGKAAVQAGTQERRLMWKGAERSYLLFVPKGYDASKPAPLVLAFHGFSGGQGDVLRGAKVDAELEKRGWIGVAPQGTGNPAGWNAGTCCGTASGQKVDDVGFVSELLGSLKKELCVADDQVYAMGFSNGAFFSNRLGCDLAEQIAAIGPVAGVLVNSACQPKRPVPVMAFHGTADPVVPYKGSPLLNFRPVQDNFKQWAERARCTDAPKKDAPRGNTTCERYTQCDPSVPEVTLCTVQGLAHDWPGEKDGLAATPALLDFFGRVRRPR